ncbi:MAG TPA: undecaprenyldiphospho-muramoylpentapeptide beta-N-acetylglucosaminyltransferase [Actinomycetota bacterium]|nr:undecaprenyldiphospho-muramoylpentapeptide beta-N-acetylglucosaminyltransferase [Actinomycetota bacterium]
MKVVIAGGGTAGHVNPAIALAEALEGADISFVGTARGVEAEAVPRAGLPLETIEVVGFDRARPWSFPGVGWRAVRATRSAATLLRSLKPDCVVGMGGYVSLPVGLAARRLRLPLVVHEQNIVLGLANKVLKRFARVVGVSFEETLAQVGPRGRYVGNPVGSALASCDWAVARERGLETFGLDPSRRTLLVFGGSLGAKTINDAARGLSSLWAGRSDRQVVHISGSRHEPVATEAIGGLLWRSVGYVEGMEEAYAVADLALCRGGATTVAEIAVAALPAMIVPYPYHRDRQQERHATVFAREGAAVVLADRDTTAEEVARVADDLLSDPVTLKAMGDSARSLARPSAAKDLADLVRAAAA